MRNRPSVLAFAVVLMLGMTVPAVAQGNGVQQPSARQQLQRIHTPQSIDDELARLTKDLQLTPEQQQQVRPLLQEHHDKIQALLTAIDSKSYGRILAKPKVLVNDNEKAGFSKGPVMMKIV